MTTETAIQIQTQIYNQIVTWTAFGILAMLYNPKIKLILYISQYLKTPLGLRCCGQSQVALALRRVLRYFDVKILALRYFDVKVLVLTYFDVKILVLRFFDVKLLILRYINVNMLALRYLDVKILFLRYINIKMFEIASFRREKTLQPPLSSWHWASFD